MGTAEEDDSGNKNMSTAENRPTPSSPKGENGKNYSFNVGVGVIEQGGENLPSSEQLKSARATIEEKIQSNKIALERFDSEKDYEDDDIQKDIEREIEKKEKLLREKILDEKKKQKGFKRKNPKLSGGEENKTTEEAEKEVQRNYQERLKKLEEALGALPFAYTQEALEKLKDGIIPKEVLETIKQVKNTRDTVVDVSLHKTESAASLTTGDPSAEAEKPSKAEESPSDKKQEKIEDAEATARGVASEVLYRVGDEFKIEKREVKEKMKMAEWRLFLERSIKEKPDITKEEVDAYFSTFAFVLDFSDDQKKTERQYIENWSKAKDRIDDILSKYGEKESRKIEDKNKKRELLEEILPDREFNEGEIEGIKIECESASINILVKAGEREKGEKVGSNREIFRKLAKNKKDEETPETTLNDRVISVAKRSRKTGAGLVIIDTGHRAVQEGQELYGDDRYSVENLIDHERFHNFLWRRHGDMSSGEGLVLAKRKAKGEALPSIQNQIKATGNKGFAYKFDKDKKGYGNYNYDEGLSDKERAEYKEHTNQGLAKLDELVAFIKKVEGLNNDKLAREKASMHLVYVDLGEWPKEIDAIMRAYKGDAQKGGVKAAEGSQESIESKEATPEERKERNIREIIEIENRIKTQEEILLNIQLNKDRPLKKSYRKEIKENKGKIRKLLKENKSIGAEIAIIEFEEAKKQRENAEARLKETKRTEIEKKRKTRKWWQRWFNPIHWVGK